MQSMLRITLAAGLFSVAPAGLQADFVWVDNQWGITKLTANAAAVGSAASAFGADATMNGQIKNEKDDLAVAKASAQATADPNAASDSDAAIEFERKFQLVGPPNDWNVTLSGVLDGAMHANSAGNNVMASSHVLGTAFIEDNLGNILFRIGGGGTDWDRTIKANTTLNIVSPMSNSMVLAIGQYSVFGLLEVNADVDQAPLAIASADADFFNTMLVGVGAQRVPVPSTLVLSSILFAIFGVVWSCKRLKRIAVAA